MRRLVTWGALAVLAVVSWPSAAQDETAEILVQQVADEAALPVFTGQVEVNLINLYVSVVDSKGRPVHGLTKGDFTVREDGELREITNFEAVARDDQPEVGENTVTATVAGGEARGMNAGDSEGAAPGQKGRSVALLFDSPSLEKKGRRRIIEALVELVEESTSRNDQFLVAANTGELTVLKGFTSYDASIVATLKRAAELPSTGEAQKLSKRYLKRSIYQTDLVRARRGMPGQVTWDLDFLRRQGAMLSYQIEAMRRYEADRIRRAITVAEELIQSMAGIDGRKSLIWIGEDLAMQPAYDLYNAFYRNAAFAERELNLTRPEVWGQEVELSREFQNLVAVSQAGGTTLFIIDTSDRDREAASADYRPPNLETTIAAESSGMAWTPGINLADQRSLTEGSQYAAVATGGVALSPGRNMRKALETVQEQVASYYYLGYRRPQPPDGKRHRVDVQVQGESLRVRHHETVLDRTAPQRLIDLALSRLRLDVGINPLGLEVVLGEAEPTDRDDRVLQTIQLIMPVENLVLLPAEENYSGQILVAVVVIDDEGFTAPPQLLRLGLAIPPEQMDPDTHASQAIRLLMKPGTRKIAVSVRDEVSGVEGSQSVEMAASDI